MRRCPTPANKRVDFITREGDTVKKVLKELWDVYRADGTVVDGKLAIRGHRDLLKNEYHLVVYVWIINDKNEVIISRRQKGKTFEGMWECTGGCAKRGDTSLQAALREVKEELGLDLDPEKGEKFKRYIRKFPKGAAAICDVWVFRQNFELDDIVVQEREVSQAKIIPITEFLDMMSKSKSCRKYKYANELYEKYCKN